MALATGWLYSHQEEIASITVLILIGELLKSGLAL
jgi:hypothetical protein